MPYGTAALVILIILLLGGGALWAWRRRCCCFGRILWGRKHQGDLEAQLRERPVISGPVQQKPEWQEPMYQQQQMIYGQQNLQQWQPQHHNQAPPQIQVTQPRSAQLAQPPQRVYATEDSPYNPQPMKQQYNYEPSPSSLPPQQQQMSNQPYLTPLPDLSHMSQARESAIEQPRMKTSAMKPTVKKSSTKKSMKAQPSGNTTEIPSADEASSPMPKPLRLKTDTGLSASKTTPKKKFVPRQDSSEFEDVKI